ncbi:MAG: Na+/H+ antiporter NhaA [bacterium]
MFRPLTNLLEGRGQQFVRDRFMQPISEFVNTEASGGIILLVATAAALLWANSPWDYRYFDLIHAHMAIDLGIFSIDNSLGHLVNDGLMTVFFFVVGLEIKRELIHGELASKRKAALPVAAALGGMVVPALIYVGWNAGGDGAKGWGIPMATDIAFAMGVLALLGRRAPLSLKVFLLALAIVDDLGAILVIAIFYTDSISLEALIWAGIMLAVIVAVARAGVHSTDVYVLLGILFWAAVYKSGIHATLAGVVLAMLTPARPRYTQRAFEGSALDLLVSYRYARDRGDTEQAQQVLEEFETLSRGTESPLDRLEHTLHPWVSYLIVPIFALVNAGVVISSGLISDSVSSPISLGVATGLVIGKPVGILLACFIAVRLGIADLPSNTNYGHILGLGMIAGIGFTVSLFITGLAFDSAVFIDEAKLAILAASALAGVAGFVYLWIAPGEPDPVSELDIGEASAS